MVKVCKTPIYNFERSIFTVHEDIARLDVAMNDALGVGVFKPKQDLKDILFDALLCQSWVQTSEILVFDVLED